MTRSQQHLWKLAGLGLMVDQSGVIYGLMEKTSPRHPLAFQPSSETHPTQPLYSGAWNSTMKDLQFWSNHYFHWALFLKIKMLLKRTSFLHHSYLSSIPVWQTAFLRQLTLALRGHKPAWKGKRVSPKKVEIWQTLLLGTISHSHPGPKSLFFS